MRRCRHLDWLHVTKVDKGHGGDFTLQVSDRLDRVIDELPWPATQHPSVVMMVGSTHKARALQAILGTRRTRTGTARDGDLDLIVDNNTAFNPRPIIYVDIHSGRSLRRTPPRTASCHRSWQVSVGVEQDAGPVSDMSSLDRVAAQVVAPFADVLCVFIPDFPNLGAVWKRLLKWVRLGAPSTLYRSTRPHLVLVGVGATPLEPVPGDVLGRLSDPTFEALKEVFSGVTTVAIDDCPQLLVETRYQRLKQEL